MSSSRHKWLILSLALRVMGCSAKPENSPSGACSLSCGNARVAASGFKVVPLVKALEVKCTEDFAGKTTVPLTSPIVVRFKVTQSLPTAFSPAATTAAGGAGAAAGAAGGGATAATPSPVVPITELPVASVGFDPIVYGNMAFAKTAADFQTGNGDINPARYAGVVTPPSEWCSDSCGIMTYEVWPNCVSPSGQTVTAGVAAGGVSSDKPEDSVVTITVSNP